MTPNKHLKIVGALQMLQAIPTFNSPHGTSPCLSRNTKQERWSRLAGVGAIKKQEKPSNSTELKADESVHAKTSRHEMEGTFTIEKENILAFTFAGHESQAVRRIEGNTFIPNVGDVSIKH